MCISIEQQRQIELIEVALHDAIVRVAGGSRFQRDGKPIRYFGSRHAADELGMSESEVRNRADPSKQDTFNHRHIQKLLFKGMDPIWLEELISALGGVVIWPKDLEEHETLTDALAACISEFGDIGEALKKARSKASAGGRAITRKEMVSIRREVDEEVTTLYSLVRAAEHELKS